MRSYEQVTDVAGRASSLGERRRWDDVNMDPDLLDSPANVAAWQAVTEQATREQASAHPLAWGTMRQAEQRFGGAMAASGAGVEVV